MTVKLYDENAYLKEFEATVLDSYPMADGFFTILDRTAFFPEGGGQPADIGNIDGVKVYDVQIKDGIIYHYTTKQFKKGEKVKGCIDFSRRFDFMQQHSGEHIVSGIAHSLYRCENVGFHLGEEITTIDFDKMLSKEEILELQRRANEKIFENVKIFTSYPDEETLKNLNYRSKKEILEDIRIVEIDNTDICACCAPHVKSAGEIGLISLTFSEKVRGGVRLELKCGKRALDSFEMMQKNISAIASALCSKPEETACGVERLLNQISDLKFQLGGYKKQLLENKIENFVPTKDITTEFTENTEMKDLQHFADGLYKKSGGVRCVFSKNGDGFMFVFCGEPQKTDDLFKEFKENFDLRGGGRNGMVQGTVFADSDSLADFFDKY